MAYAMIIQMYRWRVGRARKLQMPKEPRTEDLCSYTTILKMHRWRARRQRKSEMNRNRGKNILMI